MRLLSYLYFWMLVYLTSNVVLSLSCTMAQAAQTHQNSNSKIETNLRSDKTTESSETLNKKESTNLGYPDNYTPITASELENTARKSQPKLHAKPTFGLQLGFLTGNTVSSSENNQAILYGLNYFAEINKNQFDFEANFQSDRIINLVISQKWILNQDDLMKPYMKLGAINHIDATDALAGLVNINHLKIRGALGFFDLFDLSEKMYSELGLAYGPSGPSLDIKIGYTF